MECISDLLGLLASSWAGPMRDTRRSLEGERDISRIEPIWRSLEAPQLTA